MSGFGSRNFGCENFSLLWFLFLVGDHGVGTVTVSGLGSRSFGMEEISWSLDDGLGVLVVLDDGVRVLVLLDDGVRVFSVVDAVMVLGLADEILYVSDNYSGTMTGSLGVETSVNEDIE
jgi:hypothetical protein